ncbi:MAG: Phenylalanyl-tRNA synthetase beta chain [Gammaproteobacteria bacterium]|nr:Phenylalanyl-tRNA synthetase beta chain [Gammaproteobacteria bacterium]
MKISTSWLREWVNPALSAEALCEKLTLSGLEVESLTSVAEKFSSVVIAQIIHIEKHPEADRLQVCRVNVGEAELLTIVCGAKNIKEGMKVPAALVGAVLPNNIKITRSKLRGVVSNGMLCSAGELTLAEDSGILELPKDAPIGQDVWDYLKLSDEVMDISITPNRGDCLSVQGLAREIAAMTECEIDLPSISETKAIISDQLPIIIQAPEACPHYVGRIIKHVKANTPTPVWLQERLRRSGISSISAIVDVMNYVMLELGQPMHAFDLQKISEDIQIRMADPSEELVILDGQTVRLDSEILVIADHEKPLAIAGIMGGLDSGISSTTQHIFLESAFFNAIAIARTRQKYHLGSESSHRFERGIDPTQQVKAIERATELLLSIVGGQPAPIIDKVELSYLPSSKKIQLRIPRIQKILGFSIEESIITSILNRLGFSIEKNTTAWQVTVPAYRSDIALEIDLIEEIIRLYGYDQLPLHQTTGALAIYTHKPNVIPLLRESFCNLGYREVITYSFIDAKRQKMFDPDRQPLALLNPITTDMSVMRTQLWPGLVDTLLYNQNRQQSRVRLFETGLRFLPQEQDVTQQRVISGLISGTALPEQWGITARPADYFDLKGDLENSIRSLLPASSVTDFIFKPTQHPALHPGKAAEMYYKDRFLGIFGALHPSIVQEIGDIGNVLVFELLLDELDMAQASYSPVHRELSKFPEIRRDIAIYVDQTVPSQQIQDTIAEVGGQLLKEVNVFDVYQGKGVPPNRKSIALALLLQHASRTLLDEEVADIIDTIISALKQRFAAELRG